MKGILDYLLLIIIFFIKTLYEMHALPSVGQICCSAMSLKEMSCHIFSGATCDNV